MNGGGVGEWRISRGKYMNGEVAGGMNGGGVGGYMNGGVVREYE
jgi:hypothetical protein